MSNPTNPVRSEWRPGSLNRKESHVEWLEILEQPFEDTDGNRTVRIPLARSSQRMLAGKPVVTEKPVATDPEDSTDIMMDVPTLPVEAWALQPLPPRNLAPKPALAVRTTRPRAKAAEPMTAHSERQSLAKIVTRPGAPERASMTEFLTLAPEFLEALRGIAPKKRRSPISYVIGFAVVAILGVLAADASAREFIVAKAQETGMSLSR